MDLTTDKYRSMVKKWQTLIEGIVEAKITDGYLLRVFCIGSTAKNQQSQGKTCYAQHSQVRKIRIKMHDTITEKVTKFDLKQLVDKLDLDSIAKDIEKCQGIYPLHDVYIRKVKLLKKPRFHLSNMLELHGDGGSQSTETVVSAEGAVIDRPEGYEPPVQE